MPAKISRKKMTSFFAKLTWCVCISFWSIFFLMFFEVISHPDFFHQDLVFSPYILAFVRISLLLIWVNRESLLSRMIANLTTHLSLEKKCLFNVISASIRSAIFTLSNLNFLTIFGFLPQCAASVENDLLAILDLL